MTQPDVAMVAFAREHALIGTADAAWEPLTGGVSSDIWHVSSDRGEFCIKRALPKLKVAATWEVPVDRNAFEWRYMEVASAIVPGAVPAPIAHDADQGLFAMAWLAPDRHPLWKTELLAGRADPGFAAAVGELLGRIHKATADDNQIANEFATDANFNALRLDAYLLETGRCHRDLYPTMQAISEATASNRRALVHGDVSPKNILAGPDGPVLLDAECAWFGDPAFDLAFCLNHLVIKARILDRAHDALSDSFDAIANVYFRYVDWEPAAQLEERASRLLPALALARVDGKSPVEYLSEEQRSDLRAAAHAAILAKTGSIGEAKQLLLS